MRSMLIVGLLFTLATVPAVQAQQVAVPASAEQPAPRVVEVPMPRTEVDLTPARAAAVQSREAVTAEAAREMSARTLLAVIGAALVVVALVVLLN